MKTLTYIIVDDEALCRFFVSKHLQQYPFLKESGVFSSAETAKKFLMQNKVDILFSDIEMPGASGLSLVENIKDAVSYTVFITTHQEYAIDSYDLDANDYILKPLDKEKIEKMINKLNAFFETKEKADLYKIVSANNSMKIKVGYEYQSVDINEIVYLLAEKDYTKLVSRSEKKIMIRGNLSTILKNDKFEQFIRIHKSYAISKNHIQAVKLNSVIMSNGVELPVGRAYKEMIVGLIK